MPQLLVTCSDRDAVARNYLPAVRAGGWEGGVRLVAAEGQPAAADAWPSGPTAAADGSPALEDACGLLLTGGADIHPRRWDPAEAVHPAAEPDLARDALEHPLVRAAWAASLPILGICRGTQVLNVALGGGLIQDIPSWFGCADARHRCGGADDPVLAHQVTLAPASRLAAALRCGRVLPVNSRHHQAVAAVAPSLAPVAWDPLTVRAGSRLIEAVEAPEPDRWVIGVQWHPEGLVDLPGPAGQAARKLFAAFAAALCAAAQGRPQQPTR
jgi:putative glutamine amidotransferase